MPVKKLPENLTLLAKQWERRELKAIEFIRQTGIPETALYRHSQEHKVVRDKKIIHQKADLLVDYVSVLCPTKAIHFLQKSTKKTSRFAKKTS